MDSEFETCRLFDVLCWSLSILAPPLTVICTPAELLYPVATTTSLCFRVIELVFFRTVKSNWKAVGRIDEDHQRRIFIFFWKRSKRFPRPACVCVLYRCAWRSTNSASVACRLREWVKNKQIKKFANFLFILKEIPFGRCGHENLVPIKIKNYVRVERCLVNARIRKLKWK